MKKAICAALMLILLCALLGGCEKPSMPTSSALPTAQPTKKQALVGDIPCAFPLTQQTQTMRIMMSGYDDVKQETVYVWRQYEKMTNVRIDWTTIQRGIRKESVFNALTNRQPYDLLLRCKVSSDMLMQYGGSGLIIDLAKDDLLKNNAPNCWAYMQKHPDTLASVTNPDGTIYALPQVNSGAELRVSSKIFINKRWLENVRLTVPTTTQELYALLAAFKASDANGNGDPNDEIPLCPAEWSSLRDCLYGAFGLGNRGTHNLTVDCDPETGGTRLIEGSDAYRDFLAYCGRLYQEGLLDNAVFGMTQNQWYDNIQNDRVGVFMMTNLALLPADKMNDWVAVEDALTGPNGDRLWSAVRANMHSTGAAIIPATCRDPALALRWLDYFWTDEGTLFYHMGVEGETYEQEADGSYDYLPAIYDEIANGSGSFDDVIGQYSPYPGGNNPTVEVAPYFMGGEMASVPAQAAVKLFAYGPEEYWPIFTFTPEESERLTVIVKDMDKYCASMRIAFINGTKPLSDWSAYTAQLEKLGGQELLTIYQSAVDRYARIKSAHPNGADK